MRIRHIEQVRWKTERRGCARLNERLDSSATARRLSYVRYLDDFPALPDDNIWTDIRSRASRSEKLYVVQTATKVVERCVLMTTDPGDLVLDPTCGSGTTAYVAEQWGRRWITIDTSRVALALARARIMGARYPYYLLADSPEGFARRPRSAAARSPTSRHTATSATASSTSACRTSR